MGWFSPAFDTAAREAASRSSSAPPPPPPANSGTLADAIYRATQATQRDAQRETLRLYAPIVSPPSTSVGRVDKPEQRGVVSWCTLI